MAAATGTTTVRVPMIFHKRDGRRPDYRIHEIALCVVRW